MTSSKIDSVELREVGEAALKTAQRWTKASKNYPTDRAAQLLSEALKDPSGLDYTVEFVDQVIRPEDQRIAAQKLAELGAKNPAFLPWYLRAPARFGGAAAPLAPSVATPVARKVFSQLVGDLVVDVTDKKLGPAIKRLRANGARLNINLLGEAVLGDKEADKRLKDTLALLRRDDVDYVSLKVSAVTGPHSAWAFDETVDRAVQKLLPLYRLAAETTPNKFINLDMEEYRDLELTLAVFKRILSTPGLEKLEAGIVLQAYLPDALGAMKDLQEWAAERRAKGGSGIKVRVVKGANLAMERVEANSHDWPLTVCDSKEATDANYMRVLNWAMTPEHLQNVRLGVAGHNLFTIAFAWELAGRRNVRWGVELEMLSGMATAQADAVAAEVGNLLLYVPVVNPAEYDVAISYLVRRLEENAADENYMSAVFELPDNPEMFARERDRFLAAMDRINDDVKPRNRTQNRQTESADEILEPLRAAGQTESPARGLSFANTPDSDPSLMHNLEWAREIIGRFEHSDLGKQGLADAKVNTEEELEEIMARASAAGREWVARPIEERVEILHNVGLALAKHRGELIEVAGSEAGKTFDQGDVEVSEAVDFSHYYAESALKMVQETEGAKFTPTNLTVVTPPWNFPLAIPAGGVLAALSAGSAVVFKPAAAAARCGAVLAEIMWEAGVPRDLLAFVSLGERALGKQLLTDQRVGRVVLTGGSETADLFRSWRSDLPLLAETSGKNAIVVTPSADLDLAVKDVVYSAFGHAGQKCSAASLVILVGSVGTSARFARQLVDAVNSLQVGYPWDPTSEMGPVIAPPTGKLKEGLTGKLGEGERWIVKPEQLDDSGKLWSPGVRSGVQPGSAYHLTEYFGPILGVMRAETLEQAVEWVNQVDYGLTSGIHSLDAEEINYWIDNVHAGNLYINRGTTGAIVQRQPFGGWKRSAVGNGAKAGGPNYLYAFGNWAPAPTEADSRPVDEVVNEAQRTVKVTALSELLDAARDQLSGEDLRALAAAYISDQRAWNTEFGVYHDPTGIPTEKNVLRYVALPVTVRLDGDNPKGEEAEGVFQMGAVAKLLRVIGAGLRAGAPVTVSTALDLPERVRHVLEVADVKVHVEDQEHWLRRVKSTDWGLDGRIRLINGAVKPVSDAAEGSIDLAIWADPVTEAGRVEMLPFVHEQAISFTNHRFGNHTPLSESVL
ncbi:proline dehydrogenase family protein [Boudabousia marimammalium]|uniref:L-glutamate gamma-semialdehyde dehydrogenase n=1 Tax=Boudabousia marimammalium TaxID=156892 RepID=A0A1Q5PKH4_9ACTO|nr:proline dehydrogenase family protein [Boudabousia marimammalium]OKL46718.1 1-pyrroline-5-carboxylate dehydrogenase [Boudabousia marimammalium]